MHWKNVNGLVIWDNRCNHHAATPDYISHNLRVRIGSRSVSAGERPYFEPESVSPPHSSQLALITRIYGLILFERTMTLFY
ncbi:tfdA family Taurine catabolism dioxygenase TauD [Colletotrichum asianum]|uniref:TfdA family Taurine catabolism dioxygenase TauD n=1 Tax=Colletotrichum asianum TaxID=702518 RepID=A0A8H3VZ13_9PEZI|nr:tfdA family Taurine catabolism dioxygenase TauD [Colletotrichum asianum]